MLKQLIILSFFSLLLTSFLVPEKVEKKANKEIEKFFEVEEFSKEYISISDQVSEKIPASFSENNFFRIKKGTTLLGYGYIGNAPSKTATFDYLVLFDQDFIITKSKVLIYREEYGGEIGSKRWLEQFEGSSSKTPELELVKDIIPISGATISAQSMTKAINQLLESIKILKQENHI
ncbi:FMN-binding protein [Aureisphaera sp. CAU 1614]|uniref:FMN-binding protein n=1 Tax=Halomarinibacterium sedimenti TaxID=2857106 RepID=A0A9X1FNG6_9FLAO|nr:FMN-binding protein [Halomarinibacterium sedimenti]MBW2937590.1 FMN-binding protein [Halomarinibacterium sedimenti]